MAKGKSSKFLKEFKEFAMRGNVIDLAVGVVVGGAFGKITTSIVNDIIMPFVGMFIGGINFADWTVTLPHLYGPVPETPEHACNRQPDQHDTRLCHHCLCDFPLYPAYQ